ncbi:MAG: rhombotarget lipoprotein, partial [Woeseia sp.]
MNKFRIVTSLTLLCVLSGCASLWGGAADPVRRGSSSSLVDFLYPDGAKPEGLPDRLPYLELPVRVGIAFVPGNSQTALPANEQQILLERVAASFRDRPYVSHIEVIPESDLRSARGMQGMQQVAGLFDVDIMALVSYDQLALAGERDSAILYWTVVGALVVKGNVNEVQTMIDTAVFDVASTKLLFRAPGTHRNSENATFMDADRDM